MADEGCLRLLCPSAYSWVAKENMGRRLSAGDPTEPHETLEELQYFRRKVAKGDQEGFRLATTKAFAKIRESGTMLVSRRRGTGPRAATIK